MLNLERLFVESNDISLDEINKMLLFKPNYLEIEKIVNLYRNDSINFLKESFSL